VNLEFKDKEIPDFEIKDESEKKRSFFSYVGEFLAKSVLLKRLEIKFTWKF
jgi:hypothetical protein